MIAAAVDAVAEVGYAHMTVAQVIGRARVSRKTFYDVFGDRRSFLAAFEEGIERGTAAAPRRIRDSRAGARACARRWRGCLR